ncbi:MAG: aldo/keto reductase [Planctomycetia bacterium]|nr:aldo/keto reductase [Planctomycetia bacterium]
MQIRELTTDGLVGSVVALGTWALGGWMWGGCDDAEAERTVLTALDHGVTLIDTAPIYGFGRSEETVGRALRGRRRDSYVLATKCGLSWFTQPQPEGRGEWHCFCDHNGRTPQMSSYAVYRWLRPDVIRVGVEDSLRRLRTDYIDLMQVHHVSDRTTPVAETMGVLEELRNEGKIRAIGVSNANVFQLREYSQYGALSADQERYSMLDRSVERNGVLDLCREQNLAFLAYSPMENGLLTGKLDPERVYKPGDLRANNPKFSKANVEKVNRMLGVVSELARRVGLTVGQFAIAWVASRYERAFVLCGARTPEQAIANAQAGTVSLSQDIMEEAEEIIHDML